jgi:hypothetical protein
MSEFSPIRQETFITTTPSTDVNDARKRLQSRVETNGHPSLLPILRWIVNAPDHFRTEANAQLTNEEQSVQELIDPVLLEYNKVEPSVDTLSNHDIQRYMKAFDDIECVMGQCGHPYIRIQYIAALWPAFITYIAEGSVVYQEDPEEASERDWELAQMSKAFNYLVQKVLLIMRRCDEVAAWGELKSCPFTRP